MFVTSNQWRILDQRLRVQNLRKFGNTKKFHAYAIPKTGGENNSQHKTWINPQPEFRSGYATAIKSSLSQWIEWHGSQKHCSFPLPFNMKLVTLKRDGKINRINKSWFEIIYICNLLHTPCNKAHKFRISFRKKYVHF